ncbi:class I SAM-dependent methyltransferase [Pseudoxanthomonas wuyuanensis]|uniref:Methyltransferase domain-containing protein n=1 Tax=Pseudoxanthomonas wuyuanensis TaxID=1073196 RepID=A0A286D6U2_9GAMM|nr:methyltransferase domain-containing protein [Pseudoxanthomonas wuyuanensis]KAF1719076.1 class I SAM-dependent methyltransferase [Pseudoxanthomonas wuyuanensis]SOD54383.1 Methyltransferase domain-containing protein [Pseudoxanthomonas wuyuanensis]
MAQYQSFPDVEGDSRTLEKLKALSIPDLAGRRFLDVGCNEGYFCGFAKFRGAERVVGIDHSRFYIERARKRFPTCEFLAQPWGHLPEGPYEVILLASALHYADDQNALIRQIMNNLTPDGTLVLELGIASSPTAEWKKVSRGIDERLFPSMPMVKEMLSDYAWKWIGPSVSQEGDPVPRHVIHVTRKRPMAYLLMQPPGYGKTSMAEKLFQPAGVRVISGDEILHLVSQGRLPASKELTHAIRIDYSPFRIDSTVRRLFDEGHGAEFVSLLLGSLQEDFALDTYVPAEHRNSVVSLIKSAGFVPMCFEWERPGEALLPMEVSFQAAENYHLFLQQARVEGSDPTQGYDKGAQGFVDEVCWLPNRVVIRGWAVDARGRAPRVLSVRVDGKSFLVRAYERQSRPDVQSHLNLPHPRYGYQVSVPLEKGSNSASPGPIEVRAGTSEEDLGVPLRFSSNITTSDGH